MKRIIILILIVSAPSVFVILDARLNTGILDSLKWQWVQLTGTPEDQTRYLLSGSHMIRVKKARPANALPDWTNYDTLLSQCPAEDTGLFTRDEYSESESRVREFIEQRTSPSFYVGYPSISELEEILKTRIVPVSEEIWIDIFMEMFKDIELSVRDAINILEFAYKKSRDDNARLSKKLTEKYLKDALTHFPHVKLNVSEQTKLTGNDNVYFGLKNGREKSIH